MWAYFAPRRFALFKLNFYHQIYRVKFERDGALKR